MAAGHLDHSWRHRSRDVKTGAKDHRSTGKQGPLGQLAAVVV